MSKPSFSNLTETLTFALQTKTTFYTRTSAIGKVWTEYLLQEHNDNNSLALQIVNWTLCNRTNQKDTFSLRL